MKNMPWDNIQIPSNDYNVRLAAGSGKIPVYWGRDDDNHCLLIIELAGDHTERYRENVLPVHGMRIDLRHDPASPERQRLILTLERQTDRDIFSGLCQTLIGTLSPVSEPAVALEVVLEHLRRWKTFLSGRNTRVLSQEEIRGLFGELHFLRSLYRSGKFSETSSVNAWCGPEGTHHDFIFGDIAVEIKTLSGRERNSVKITSEDQLEIMDGALFLEVYRLNDLPESPDALSLNALVNLILEELGNTEATEQFQLKLTEAGYIQIPDYDSPNLVVTGRIVYQVTEQFPRLIRSWLPEGVFKVTYELKLEHITGFEVSETEIFAR